MFLSDHASHIADIVDVLDGNVNDGCHTVVKDLTVSIHGNSFRLILNENLDPQDYEIQDLGKDLEPEVSEVKPAEDKKEQK